MQNAIEVKNLVKKYHKAKENAVDDVSFSVKTGEFFVLLGPNGAGKTTTVSILTTTLSKTSGEVTILGYDLDKHASKVRQNAGIIFQGPSLDENLTAEENVRLHASLYGLHSFRPLYSMMPKEYKTRINELSSVLGIENDIFKPIKTLSGGMKRKLEIVRSLMHKPKVLFLDEPTTGLDPVSRRNLWGYLRDVRKQNNMTIFLTTHYLEEAEEADMVCIINKGKVEVLDSPDNFKKKLLKEHLIIDAYDRDQLKKDLAKFDIQLKKDTPYEIELNDVSAQKIIKNISVPLTELSIVKPTLEEAYLSIIDANGASTLLT